MKERQRPVLCLNVLTKPVHQFGRVQIMGERAHVVSSCSHILKHRSLSVNWTSENDQHRMIVDS